MKKQIAIAAAIAASFALWAAVCPQNTVNKETTPAPAVTAPQAMLLEPAGVVIPLTTELEKVDGTIVQLVLE